MVDGVALIGYCDGRWLDGMVPREDYEMDCWQVPSSREGKGTPWWRLYVAPIEDEL